MSQQQMISRCRSCSAEIVWVEVANDKGKKVRVPLNRRRVRSYQIDPAIEGDLVHISHFQTCPDANSWSKGRA